MSDAQVTITDPRGPAPGGPERVRAWVALMKPRIIELLLITTVPAMVLAEGGWPDTWLVVATVVGGSLSAGGANAINNVVDRDLDAKMRRTAHRPLPAHRVGPTEALVVGFVAGSAGFAVLALAVNLASALLATGALAFYVLVYSLVLKRSTTQNIVIGGAAGAVPVLVGWAAVTGEVGLPAWVMFAVIFFWTPPHFWALSLRFREDYERAGVPMLPVVAGVPATIRQIGVYSVLLAGLGMVYLGAAALLGAWFIIEAARLTTRPDRAILVFRASNIYLTLLFAAVAVDVLI
jgi:protoheme IX farnesyltransferase